VVKRSEERTNSRNLPLYHAWLGKVFLQLTSPSYYKTYWLFRRRTISNLFNDFI